jgi:hypothetical protein
MLLYHLVPEELSGTKLYPLNQLISISPGAYAKAVSKYAGREEVTQIVIPVLGCLWNDVVFLSPVHPEKIIRARRDAGLVADYDKKRSWFVLDSDVLDQSQTLLYRHRPKWLINLETDKTEYVPFAEVSEAEKSRLAEMPEGALWSIRKFREEAFFQSYIPHILYQGVIDVAGAEIVFA